MKNRPPRRPPKRPDVTRRRPNGPKRQLRPERKPGRSNSHSARATSRISPSPRTGEVRAGGAEATEDPGTRDQAAEAEVRAEVRAEEGANIELHNGL